jgi:hypothetical protein
MFQRAANFDYGQRQKAPLKQIPSSLEPMVPAPQKEGCKIQGRQALYSD